MWFHSLFFIIAHSLTLMYKHSTQHFLVTNQVAARYWYFQHAHSHEDDSVSVVFFKELTSFDFGCSRVHDSLIFFSRSVANIDISPLSE